MLLSIEMISILNYGMGNLASIQNMFKRIGVFSRLITTADEINKSRALVILDVGSLEDIKSALALVQVL